MIRAMGLGLTLLLAACQQAPVGPVASDLPRVVSVNPCTDAILAEVAEPEQILALSHYSSDPASSSMDVVRARAFPSTGGSVEELLALQPDLILAGNFISPATTNALDDLHLLMAQFPIAGTVEASKAQIRQIAALVEQPARGEALIARIDAALAANAPDTKNAKISAIVWQSGGMVPGGNTLIADMLSRTGFSLASSARGLGQADRLPLEAILQDPPAILLVAGSPQSQEDRLLGHPVLKRLENTRRIPLDKSLLWCGGPTIVRAANWLGDLHQQIEYRQSLAQSSQR